MLKSYAKPGSPLPEHPVYGSASGIEATSGSLGHGLPLGLGMALSARITNNKYRVYIVMSDGECNEGSVWESIFYAGHHKLNNIVVLIDYNKIQSFGFCKNILNPEPFIEKWKRFSRSRT